MSDRAAFSVSIPHHLVDGKPRTLVYDKINCDSEAWNKDTFTVPKDGIYYLSVSFMRDSHKGVHDGKTGTRDDTQVKILVGDTVVAYAWAGEASRARQAASTSTLLPLTKHSKITTQDWVEPTAENTLRRFWNIVFSGYRIGKLK